MQQGNSGSCVGCAVAKGLEMLTGDRYSAEWVYGRSRAYFNKKHGAGSNCAWAMQTLHDIGAIKAQNYALLGVDLTEYSSALANNWERGPPLAFDYIAETKRFSFVKIKTWEELRGAIASGHPVVVGSPVGFGQHSGQSRDSLGRLRSRWWSKWSHAMLICGVSDGQNKQALLLNSWGTGWVSGPKFLGDEMDGSFWVSRHDAVRMLSYGDAYAITFSPEE